MLVGSADRRSCFVTIAIIAAIIAAVLLALLMLMNSG